MPVAKPNKSDEPATVTEERPTSIPTHEDLHEAPVGNTTPIPVIPPQGPLHWTQSAPAVYSAYGSDGKAELPETAAIGPAPTTIAAGAVDKPEGLPSQVVTLSDTDKLRMDQGRPPITPATVSGLGEAVNAEKQKQYAQDDPEGTIKAPEEATPVAPTA